MSLYSLFKYIFSHDEYSTINIWYENSVHKYPEEVWQEYVKRVNPKSIKDTYEYKESLYLKRELLTSLETIYIKSNNLYTKYSSAISDWKSMNNISTKDYSFKERKLIVDNEESIEEFVKNVQIANKYNYIKGRYEEGVKYYLRDHPEIDVNTIEGKNIVSLNFADIICRNQNVEKYENLEKNYPMGVQSFLVDNPSTSLISYSRICLILENEEEIKGREIVAKKHKALSKRYPVACRYFMQTNPSILPYSYEGMKLILENETKILKIHGDIGRYKDLKKEYPEAYDYYTKSNPSIDIDTYAGICQILNDEEEIRTIDGNLQKIEEIKQIYPKGLESYLKLHPSVDTTSYPGILDICNKEKEIRTRNSVISTFHGSIKKKYLEAYICFFNSPEIPNTFSYDEMKMAVDKREELKLIQDYINQIISYKMLYPNAFEMMCRQFEDTSISQKIKEPHLRLKRSKIREIAGMGEAMDVTEKYLVVLPKYNKEVLGIISDSVKLDDLTDEGIEKKKQLIMYDKYCSNYRSSYHPLNLKCDIDERKIKVRCILNSELYGNNINFNATYTTNYFYDLASRIKGYNKTFDEILQFRNKNEKAINSFNKVHVGRAIFYIDDIDRIGRNDEELLNWIKAEHKKEAILEKKKTEVAYIKSNFPLGYNIYLQSNQYNEKELSIEDLDEIIENQFLIVEYEQREKAKAIINRYPEGVQIVLRTTILNNLSIENIRRIVHEENQIALAQQQINEARRKEQEKKQKIDNAKSLALNYSVEFRTYFPNISIYNLTINQAERILSYRNAIINAHNFHNRINNSVSDWERLSGIPYYFFYYYYPKRFTDITSASERAKTLIYDFKNGDDYNQVLQMVKKKLTMTFSQRDLDELCFVCIPASTTISNNCRYRDFSNDLCSELNMYNGFEYIEIIKEKVPTRLYGDGDCAEYQIDESFFDEKYVILFDDVVTRGRSMRQFKTLLENAGATIVCALSIGRTYSDYYGDDREPHPWTNEY